VAIDAGKHLLHYRLIEKIGEGGMGVVWKALDTELHRHVALKVLPPELTNNEERRLRFQREAQASAALGHANIAVIHGVGEDGGVQFLAMEYVRGVTLRQHMAGSAGDQREWLRLALQVAEGLAHAHANGVVHRDLKPDNVMVTTEGQVKILDFGLAKLLEPRPGLEGEGGSRADTETALDTISRELTRAGKVYGTVSYMSPEQARGGAIDARSDLFSFGITLYEIVTGKLPFAGDSAMDTLSAILRARPEPVVASKPDTPAELQRILDKCLEKEPRDRYQDTRDLVVDLRRLRRETDSQAVQRIETTSGVQVQTGKPRRSALGWAAGALAVVAIAIAAWYLLPGLRQSPGARQDLRPMQLTANPPGNPITATAISPDGKYLAYADYEGVYFRLLSSGEDHRLELEEGFCFR
jgi:serine/threonine protein kinase